MLCADSLQSCKKIFQLFATKLGCTTGLFPSASIYNSVQCMTVLQQIVDTCHHTEDAEAVNPDPDNSDNTGSLPTNEPAENAEQGR